jgi:transposase
MPPAARVSERLVAGLGIPITDTAVLRQLKSHVRKHRETEPLRAIAIDDWSRRKGFTYGTIIVDLERRTVADMLKTRSAQATELGHASPSKDAYMSSHGVKRFLSRVQTLLT